MSESRVECKLGIPAVRIPHPESCRCKYTSSLDYAYSDTFWNCNSPQAKYNVQSGNQAGQKQSVKQRKLSQIYDKIKNSATHVPHVI